MVPESGEVFIDCRRIPGHSATMILEGLCGIAQRLRLEDPIIDARVEIDYSSDGLDVPRDVPVVGMAEELSGAAGIPVPFGTEAPLYASIGIPSIGLGPGSVEQAHVPDEFAAVADIRKASKIYGELIKRTCFPLA